MLFVPSTVGTLNTGGDTFYIANNGGVSRSTGEPLGVGSFTTVLTQPNLAAAAGTGDEVTLTPDSLLKVSPGRQGVPRMVVFQNRLYMARNIALGSANTTQIKTSNGGELWTCANNCTVAGNWTRVFTSSPAGSNSGIEITNNSSISMLEVNGNYLYVGFDNMADGARVYRSNGIPAGPGSFTELGRDATAACTNHSGNTGALGKLCHGYQILSSAAISKGSDDYLYLTVGCTLATESANGLKCDVDPTAAFLAPPVRVLVQRD
jgi:hypothetical protein